MFKKESHDIIIIKSAQKEEKGPKTVKTMKLSWCLVSYFILTVLQKIAFR